MFNAVLYSTNFSKLIIIITVRVDSNEITLGILLFYLLFHCHQFYQYDQIHRLLLLIDVQEKINQFYTLVHNIVIIFFVNTDCCLVSIGSYWLNPSLVLKLTAAAFLQSIINLLLGFLLKILYKSEYCSNLLILIFVYYILKDMLL